MNRTMKALFFALFGMWFLTSSPALGAIYRVNSEVDTSDSDLTDGRCDDGTGFCTLRAAIEQANANEESDSVILGETTYFLTEGPLWIQSSIRILAESPTRRPPTDPLPR